MIDVRKTVDNNTMDALAKLQSGAELTPAEVVEVRQQMFNIGMLGRKQKISGGNKQDSSSYKAKAKAKVRRKISRNSRRINRTK